MNIFPAIDLKENKCVRLIKGEDNTSIVFNENPVDQAKYFEEQGCKRLHLVDLDSAFGRNNINDKTIQKILDRVKEREFNGYSYDGADASFEILVNKVLGKMPEYFEVISFNFFRFFIIHVNHHRCTWIFSEKVSFFINKIPI